MSGNIDLILKQIREKGKDIDELQNEGHDFFDVLAAHVWHSYAETGTVSDSIRQINNDELDFLSENGKKRFLSYLYSGKSDPVKAEHFLDIAKGISHLRDEPVDEGEMENLFEMIFEDRVV